MKAPYGSWKSPITTDLIVSRTIGLDEIRLDGDDIYWIESRPEEDGRSVIVRRTPDGKTSDVTPPPFNVRSRAHEYGGGAYTVAGGVVFFSHCEDGRVYRLDSGSPPRPLTPAGDYRYADLLFDQRRRRLICVREDHTGDSRLPADTLIAIDSGGSGEVVVLASGRDFYSTPRLSPDGERMAYLTWDLPSMPWDGTELWVAELSQAGSPGPARMVAGGAEESIFQPEWSPDGLLHYVSDRSGWWNIYRETEEGVEPVCELAAEFGLPQWVFGMSTYAFASEGTIICGYTRDGIWRLGAISTATKRLREISSPYTDITGIRAGSGKAVFLAASSSTPAAVVRYDSGNREMETLRSESSIVIDPGYLSLPETVEFPTGNGLTAHGFFYQPRNRDYAAPRGELPPLLVIMHGGPTAAATNALTLKVQFWTSRGFAVLDVNYGGSTGYGRDYRRRLYGQWGVVDVDDCANGARFLVRQGLVDGDRLVIRGGSAGGYTALSALTFRDTFRAGASYYGISELELLTGDTHKFESRYLDRLIGLYPARRDIYLERSPINFPGRISCPVIFFQGLDDRVVPPAQTEMMVEALRKKGIPVAAIYFEGEAHGFRRAATIKRSLDAELYFYARIFGFPLGEEIEPVEIENLG